MPTARSNGIEIEYEVIGPPGNRPLLLVMGLGTQMIHWDDELCAELVARGHRVIRFDNRDVGGSTKLDGDGLPNVLAAMAAASRGAAVDAPYRLSDMAADAAGLLDALEIESAHVVGASLGGMIAQTLALEHPTRVRTLTSIMSTTGHPDLPTATPDAAAVLFQPAPPDRDGNIERAVRVFRAIGSPGFPFDEGRVRERAARAYDRCFHPAGVARQMIAIVASGSRRDALRGLRMPTLVVHGADDPLIPLACGLDTAESIPGAELLIVEGMGHDLPRAVWPRLVDAVTQLTSRAA
ncbi:MAG TPA: alpha/beta hydrolase [Candidatus Binatia bacterium]|nr:alpha/beta hydrolase [Candidatus Binatia bacterium]